VEFTSVASLPAVTSIQHPDSFLTPMTLNRRIRGLSCQPWPVQTTKQLLQGSFWLRYIHARSPSSLGSAKWVSLKTEDIVCIYIYCISLYYLFKIVMLQES
jgi:hypothetical protein